MTIITIFYRNRQIDAKTDLSLVDKIELGRVYQNITGLNPVNVGWGPTGMSGWVAGVYPRQSFTSCNFERGSRKKQEIIIFFATPKQQWVLDLHLSLTAVNCFKPETLQEYAAYLMPELEMQCSAGKHNFLATQSFK